ncbi:MAG: DUF6119 family protein [Candidatus Thiodiazotropha sp.]
MASELGQISFYLSKENNTFASVLLDEKLPAEGDNFKVREFSVNDVPVKFFCIQSSTTKPENPPWLNFVNEQLDKAEEKIYFETFSKRPSGLLLIETKNRILAAAFGIKGGSMLNKTCFVPDFGIKTAMNMCGNKELRQTKTSTHSITTQHIDRQVSRPSDAFEFGLGESEFLQYISAQLEKNKKVTLQGKDSLTIKIIGEEKLSWERLIEYAETFIDEYASDNYKTLFPNYPNLQNVPDEKSEELDQKLIEIILTGDFSRIHLAIPEFISDDEYSFSYSNNPKKSNYIYSHILVDHFNDPHVLDLSKLTIKKLNNKHVYAYSHEEDRILDYKKWSLYSCIVAEIEDSGEYFVLSSGAWRKVDDVFYKSVNDFIDNTLPETDISDEYKNINISDPAKKQNREEVFNSTYCDKNDKAILFDQAKLRIGQGAKDKEFCDILEHNPNGPMNIIHVKKYGGSSSLNYLFSQARFYCEFFLSDDVFLSEIRSHITDSEHDDLEDFLNHIKERQADVTGSDYAVCLWILYNATKAAPKKSDLPLMAKYELKLAYDKLRNIHKYASVSVCMVPVQIVNFKHEKKKTGTK